MMKPITIVLTNRNTLEFLKLAIESIRKNQAVNHELIIMDDNSSDGSKDWLRENRLHHQFTYHTHDDKKRHGIVGMVDEGVAKAENDVVFIGHSDMYYAPGWEVNLRKHLRPKTVVCSTRIEPPLHGPEQCKILQNFGLFAHEFDEEKFFTFVKQLDKQYKNSTSHGIFAPVMAYKKDWIGHDQLFYPQSIEDSDLWYRMKKQGFKFVQSWDSYVYHFTSRGSRFNNETKTTLQNSEEWKKTNKKNLKNFIRRYGNTPLYTQSKEPVVREKVPISAHILACDRDAEHVIDFLGYIEPYFDEIVIVIDSKERTKGPIEEELVRYSKDMLENIPTNFDKNKFKIYYRLLDNDFARQTNFAIEQCSNEWVMKLDLDERCDERFLNHMGESILKAEEQGATVIGFPRVNLLNDVIVNDIPRDQWTEDKLRHYAKAKNGQVISKLRNPDWQFRLHKQNIRWVGYVHERPEPVVRDDKKHVIVSQTPFYHPKTVTRQDLQNEHYKKINKNPIKNLIYDSVIFTTEGITKHAREEVKELKDRGYGIQLLDWYRYNKNIENCELYKELYTPVDITKRDYAVICNQPPTRWSKTLGLNNFIGYLAFEGHLPDDWVKIMNQQQVKEIWTPTAYCKKMFQQSGVQKPIAIIPHGIDPEIWKPLNLPNKDRPFTYLWIGTCHNSRKGADVAIKAFSEAFLPDDKVRLILKVNNIYSPGFDSNKFVQKHVNPEGNQNIFFIDQDMTETEMVELLNNSDAYVSPHRSEGFGLNILQALAVGLPVIATKATGNMDFCTEENTHFIDVQAETFAPYTYPYLNAKWSEPSLQSTKEQMKKLHSNYDQHKKKAIKEAKKIREAWTWKNTVNKIENRLKELN